MTLRVGDSVKIGSRRHILVGRRATYPGGPVLHDFGSGLSLTTVELALNNAVGRKRKVDA